MNMTKQEEMTKLEEFFKKNFYKKKGTINAYTYHIKKYFKIIDKDIETYFDNIPPYNTEDKEKLKAYNLHYEPDISTFWEYLDHKAPKTKQSSIVSIKQFLRYYDKQTINLDIWRTIQVRQKGTVKAISEEHVPEIPEIKRVLEYCDIKTKTAILIGMSSGMRIGEVMQIEPRDVHLNETPTRINIRPEIAKNKQRRTTFISSEATELLNEWLRVRSDYMKDAYKSLNFKKSQHSKENKKNDPRIFPFQTNVTQHAFNKAAELAGFHDTTTFNGDDKPSEKTGKKRQRRTLHYHNLRKFFRSNFDNKDLAEHLMGHSGYLTQYRDFSDSKLASEYLKHEHNLLVFKTTSKDIENLNDRMGEKDQKIAELESRMARMMVDMQHLLIENDKKK